MIPIWDTETDVPQDLLSQWLRLWLWTMTEKYYPINILIFLQENQAKQPEEE